MEPEHTFVGLARSLLDIVEDGSKVDVLQVAAEGKLEGTTSSANAWNPEESGTSLQHDKVSEAVIRHVARQKLIITRKLDGRMVVVVGVLRERLK